MIITYFGKQFFKIQQGDLVLAINPISKDSKSGIKVSRFGANIALSTTNHPDYNGLENVSHGETVPFEISGPGDYEVQGIFIKGVLSETQIDGLPTGQAGKKFINTIYSFSVDNISICFFGPINGDKISTESREKIDPPDIVFVPISGDDTLSSAEAYKLATSFDAKIIIPMDFENGDKNIKAFLKEGGQEGEKAIDKLTIKQKELLDKEGEIIVLQY